MMEERKKEEEARLRQARKNRPPFNFEKEKPQILQTIAEASQAANNLVNALTVSLQERSYMIHLLIATLASKP